MANEQSTQSRVFISGPMTGIPDYNFPAFVTAEYYLRKLGYDVVNPVTICRKYKVQTVLADKAVFNKMIAEELAELKTCDTICLLDGWNRSVGAKRELQLALEQGLNVILADGIKDNVEEADEES